ncbi:MAG: tripartite tricarboxylate transporter substrate-binding protein [Truepera sp.]|nr:tripartite tricarboxylate transporter substrate-binding protein [Truepera sp.]
MKRLKFVLIALAAFGMTAAFAQKPSGVQCIAPSDPGGGWDFTCRTIAPVLTELGLIDGQVRSQNMAGAGGGIAYAYVVGQQGKNENLLVAASTATTTRLAQGQFQGFTADDVRWVAAVGADYGVIGVAPDSPYDSLKDLMDLWANDTSALTVVGGSAVGGWDHLKVLLAAQEAGVKNPEKIQYVSFSSGGAAIIEIVGGRADVFTGDVSEALPQIEAGNLKVLAVLSDERISSLPDVPTAKEQGIDVIGANWRGFYVPKGISDERYDYWVDAFRQLEASDAYVAIREANGLAPFARFGAEMEAFVADQVADVKDLSSRIGE